MSRWGPVVLGVGLSILASIGLGMVVGFEVLFPGAGILFETPETFAGIDRDPDTPALPSFVLPDDTGSPTRAEVLRLLRAREFATLTTAFEEKRAKIAQHIRHEPEWVRITATFSIADPALEPLLDEWMAAAPDSVAPYVARGVHRFTLAFEARGTKGRRETTREQFAGMEAHLEDVRSDARAALTRDAKEVMAYVLLIDAARAGGTQRECGDIARDGLTAIPASLSIRWALAGCRLPRWGGTHSLVDAISEKATPFLADNPDLSALGGISAWDQGRSTRGDEAGRLLDQAIAAGGHHTFFLARSRHHYDNDRFEEALNDANLGLVLSPQYPELLEYQFSALANLGRVNEAAKVLDVLAEVDPTNADLEDWRGDIARMTAEATGGGARDAYRRGYDLRQAGDDAGALAAFIDAARLDPTHFDTYLNIDYLLAKRRDWDGIIAHWDTYLSHRPDDARAYLERAGAKRQRGGIASARADLERACDLGNTQACGIAGQMGWR